MSKATKPMQDRPRLMIIWYDGERHDLGPFRSVSFGYVTQSFPIRDNTTVTYFCETDGNCVNVTVPIAHVIQAEPADQ